MDEHNFHREDLIIKILHYSFGILSVGILFFATVWCLYFLSRIRELSRKIHYLKKQTEERCYEELTNAKVDYIKSIFIAAICFFEVIHFLSIFVLEFSKKIFEKHPVNNCNASFGILDLHHYTEARVLVAVYVASLLLYTSFIHILTSYLCHAYAEKRIITLTRRDKVLISCLLIQLVVIGISTVSFHVFLFVLLLLVISLYPIHLCLYVKYSRRLYMLLKRRRLDAWFEDPDSYKKLVGMCKEYKTGSILYTVCIVLIIITSISASVLSFLQVSIKHPCVLNLIFFNSDYQLLTSFYKKYTFPIDLFFKYTFGICLNLFAVFAYFSFFLLHVLIAYGVARRLIKRRRDYRRYTGTRSVIHQPLIGRK